MEALLWSLLGRIVTAGRLIVTGPTDSQHAFGDGTGPEVHIRLTDRATAMAIAIDPNLAIGEAFVDGRLQMVSGTIYDFLALLMRNAAAQPLPWWLSMLDTLRRASRRVAQNNGPRRARHNISHHYDIDERLYDLFLDAERQYSCAYFEDGDSLETAQVRKMRHIAAKLVLRPGNRVLDIGCGWGGLATYMARAFGAHVTGITLSEEQLKAARERSWRAAISQRVDFRLEDYRETGGTFDRIVSVGMLEHVGVGNYALYFQRIRDLLAKDGVALVHTIARSDGPGFTNPFIRKYIFPGGYFPALSELMPTIERSGLIACDIEILRIHYAETLKAWRERFLARRQEALAIRDEAFCRAWEFYLAGSEAAFRYQGLIVLQIQLARRIDTVPMTRRYISEIEGRLAATDLLPSRTRHAGE